MMNIFVFIGIIAGSVANAIIYRLPAVFRGIKVDRFALSVNTLYSLRPASCYLIFLLLGGKCRYCHSPIPVRYLLVELFLGGAFVMSYLSNLGYLSYLMIWITTINAVMDRKLCL